MKSIIKFFYFNRQERKALFVFLMMLLVLHFALRFIQEEEVVQTYHHVEIKPDLFKDELVDTLKGRKEISSKVNNTSKTLNKNPVLSLHRININEADSFELRKLHGIGEKYASRIVRYRDWLGGFHKKEQLLEVYGVDSLLYHSIKTQLYLKEFTTNKININECDVKELSSHPYISYKVAKLIVKYREHHGEYSNLETLKSIPLIDEQLFRKIAFYIKLE